MKDIKQFFVKSAVKNKIKEAGLRVAGAALEELQKVGEEEIEKAIKRTKANGRKTVQPQDFI